MKEIFKSAVKDSEEETVRLNNSYTHVYDWGKVCILHIFSLSGW